MRPGVPMSTLLPEHTRQALVLASKIESRVPPEGECEARNRAVDTATAVAKMSHPQFFRKEY